jgi:hypothetical protein
VDAKWRWFLGLVLRIVLLVGVAMAIYFAWERGAPWATIGFSIFLLAMLGVEAVFTERRGFSYRSDRITPYRRRSTDAAPEAIANVASEDVATSPEPPPTA